MFGCRAFLGSFFCCNYVAVLLMSVCADARMNAVERQAETHAIVCSCPTLASDEHLLARHKLPLRRSTPAAPAIHAMNVMHPHRLEHSTSFAQGVFIYETRYRSSSGQSTRVVVTVVLRMYGSLPRDQEHKEMLRLVLPTRSPLNTTPLRTARRKVQTNDKRRVVSRQNNGFDFQTGQTIWAALDVGLTERERLQLAQAASACLMLSQLACNVRQSQDPIFG